MAGAVVIRWIWGRHDAADLGGLQKCVRTLTLVREADGRLLVQETDRDGDLVQLCELDGDTADWAREWQIADDAAPDVLAQVEETWGGGLGCTIERLP